MIVTPAARSVRSRPHDPERHDRDALASLGIHESWRWEHEFGAPPLIKFQYVLQAEHTQPDDWIVWCDSDEFQVYPAPLVEIIRQCDAAGIEFVRGVLIDRVAEDYGLPAFDAETPIWQTFPRTCNFTIALARGDPRKVVLARESQRLLDYFLANDLRFRPSDITTIALNGAHFVAFG